MQRLKTRSQFQTVLTGGIVARTAHFAMHRADLKVDTIGSETAQIAERTMPKQALVCVGALIPKRLAKRAVTRNTIRRQIYSVGADFMSGLAATGHVVRLRTGFDKNQFFSASSDKLKFVVRQELQQLFKNAATPRATATQGAQPWSNEY